MGKRRDRTDRIRSKTLPSSPSHSFSSSSSSDFEFTIAADSPRKSSAALCPADELFYKGQLLPLHLSPRISMVRTLLLSSSSTSSSATAASTSASRDSTGSSSSTSSFASDLALLAAGIDASCDSSRPSSVTDDPDLALLPKTHTKKPATTNKYFSLSRFSNVFKKDPKSPSSDQPGSVPLRKATSSSSAKDVIRKYLKKVKPLYEKLSQKQQHSRCNNVTRTTTSCISTTALFSSKSPTINKSSTTSLELGVDQEIAASSKGNGINLSHSFSGNLRYPRRTRRSDVASCPSSMRSSPSRGRAGTAGTASFGPGTYPDNSTMEELHSAIQGAIAHCKNSMKLGISNEI